MFYVCKTIALFFLISGNPFRYRLRHSKASRGWSRFFKLKIDDPFLTVLEKRTTFLGGLRTFKPTLEARELNA